MTPWSDGRACAPSLDRISQDLLVLAAITETGQEGWTRPALPDACAEGRLAELGYRQARLYSGAEHDATQMASLGPSAMLVAPPRDGRSHCPQEWTDARDISAGVHTLTQCLVAADSGAV